MAEIGIDVQLNNTVEPAITSFMQNILPTSVLDYIILIVASALGLYLLYQLLKEGFKSLIIGIGLVILCIITIKLITIL